MKIETIEVVGFPAVLKALRLPYNKEPRSTINTKTERYIARHNLTGEKTNLIVFGGDVDIANEDLKLLQDLIKRGDSHAKPARGLLAYLDITVGIGVWGEIETHRCGHERLFSASTMHTEGKGLKGLALKMEKEKISVERQLRKVDYFSYQCLRNIVKQRYNHRDPDWHAFIEHIKTLPLAKELILLGLDKELEIHQQMWNEYLIELETAY